MGEEEQREPSPLVLGGSGQAYCTLTSVLTSSTDLKSLDIEASLDCRAETKSWLGLYCAAPPPPHQS